MKGARGRQKVPARKGPASRARRSQEQRRRETQDAILRAAIDLLVEQGYARFSTIAVAAKAGVSRGARENYFRTKYDLIAAAWRAALVRATEQARTLAGRMNNSSDPIERFLRDSQSFFFSRGYVAMLELAVAARTDPALSRIFHLLFKEHRKSHDDIWIEALGRAGYARRDVEKFIGMTHYLLRGMALTSVWQLPTSGHHAVLEEWRRLAPSYLKSKRNNGSGRDLRVRPRPAGRGPPGRAETR